MRCSRALLGRGEHLAALWLLIRVTLLTFAWLLLTPAVAVKCPRAQQKSAELPPRPATWEQRHQEKASWEASVFDFTALYPTMRSCINRVLDPGAGGALVGHPDYFSASQRMILLAGCVFRALSCLFLNSSVKKLLRMDLLPPDYFIF